MKNAITFGMVHAFKGDDWTAELDSDGVLRVHGSDVGKEWITVAGANIGALVEDLLREMLFPALKAIAEESGASREVAASAETRVREVARLRSLQDDAEPGRAVVSKPDSLRGYLEVNGMLVDDVESKWLLGVCWAADAMWREMSVRTHSA